MDWFLEELGSRVEFDVCNCSVVEKFKLGCSRSACRGSRVKGISRGRGRAGRSERCSSADLGGVGESVKCARVVLE